MSPRELLERFPQSGRLEWIGVRPERGAAMRALARAELVAGRGVEGDHRALTSRSSPRQVSLVQAEHLAVIAAPMRQEPIAPGLLRRNLIVRGINLRALHRARFRIGPALLEGAGDCDPCSRLETALGFGGYNAVRGHGGIVARVLEGGPIGCGDPVCYAGPPLPKQVLDARLLAQVIPDCPELKLHVVDAGVDLDAPRRAAWHSATIPFWAFCWGAGAALARHVLGHPQLVAGRKVVDFGAGSGIAAIAAARAGAREVVAVDVDRAALAACLANAALNGVHVTTATRLPDSWDLLIAGDVLYEGADNLARIRAWERQGRRMLLAVPERAGALELPWVPVGRVQAAAFPDVDAPTRYVQLFEIGADPHQARGLHVAKPDCRG